MDREKPERKTAQFWGGGGGGGGGGGVGGRNSIENPRTLPGSESSSCQGGRGREASTGPNRSVRKPINSYSANGKGNGKESGNRPTGRSEHVQTIR